MEPFFIGKKREIKTSKICTTHKSNLGQQLGHVA